MTELRFICRIKAGTERKTLREAAKRVTSAWLPFSLQSTRPRKKRASVATVRPIFQYIFCEATHLEMMHLLQYRDIFAHPYFIPRHQEPQVEEFKSRVEAEFEKARKAYLTDTRAFHCNFKRGQIVQLRNEGMELFPATFQGIHEDGRYELSAEMLGREVDILAEPHRVTG